MTKPGDVDHYTRVRCYEALMGRYPERHCDAVPAAARDADGRPARGALARDHPQEPRLHPLHRRPRPRWPGQALRRHAVLRALRGAGAVARSTRRDRDRDGAASSSWSTSQSATSTCTRTRCRRGCSALQHLGHGAAAPALPRGGAARMVHASPRWPRSCAGPHPPAAQQGFTVFFTGLSGSGKSTIANVLLGEAAGAGGRP